MKLNRSTVAESYLAGVNGELLSPDASRIKRAAHRLGKSSYNETMKADAELTKRMDARLPAARAVSKGSSAIALAIIDHVGDLPSEHSSRVRWGTERTQGGKREYSWFTQLQTGVDKDPSRIAKHPLADTMGTLSIDSLDWFHNGYTLPIDNVVIECVSAVRGDGTVAPASTTLWINTRPYRERFVENPSADFTGGVRVDINPAGEVDYFGMTRENQSGYATENTSQITASIDELLGNVGMTVAVTVAEYRRLAADE